MSILITRRNVFARTLGILAAFPGFVAPRPPAPEDRQALAAEWERRCKDVAAGGTNAPLGVKERAWQAERDLFGDAPAVRVGDVVYLQHDLYVFHPTGSEGVARVDLSTLV